MRTYDKLIATIPGRQGTGGLRSYFGGGIEACTCTPPQATD